MRLTIHPLTSIMTTGKAMGRLAVSYCLDAIDLATLGPEQVCDLVRSWPYIADPKGTEWIQRPIWTITGKGPFRDCDDRAIVIGAWAELHGYPFQFVAVGRRPNRPHHVFCEVLIGGEWFIMDATYPMDRFNMPMEWAHRQIIFDRRQYAC